MAVGGMAFVGSTGEDYAVPFLNSVVLDTDDPSEIGIALDFLSEHPETAARIRRDAQETARSYRWENVVHDNLLGKLEYVYRRQLLKPSDPQSAAEPGAMPDAHPSSPSDARTRSQPETAPHAMAPSVAAEVGVAADDHASADETDATDGAPSSGDGGASSGAPAIGAPASDSETAPVDPNASTSVGPEDLGPSLAYGGGVVGNGLPIRPQLPVAAPGVADSPVCEFGPSQTGFPQSRVEPAGPRQERGPSRPATAAIEEQTGFQPSGRPPEPERG
jgi:hypothetical protein